MAFLQMSLGRNDGAKLARPVELIGLARRRACGLSGSLLCPRRLDRRAEWRRRGVGLRRRLGRRQARAYGSCRRGLRLADPQARRGKRGRPSVRRLFRLALSADIFVRRRCTVALALFDRLRALGVRHLSGLFGGHPRHHRRPHRLCAGCRVSTGAGKLHCRSKRLCHRGPGRRCAHSFAAAAGRRRDSARTPDLQASPWLAVSDRARRGAATGARSLPPAPSLS